MLRIVIICALAATGFGESSSDNGLSLVQTRAGILANSASDGNSSTGIPHAKSCYGWDCEIEGQFCPPDAGGSKGRGYCCKHKMWKEGIECVSGHKNNQYGYAHRVNDKNNIVYVLNKGGNIEVDIGFGGGAWRVTHFSDDLFYYSRQELKPWLEHLKLYLSLGWYDTSFVSLWLDIKNPNGGLDPKDDGPGNVRDVVQMVRDNVPSDVAVIYDLGFKNHFTTDRRGYEQILQMKLQPNEGIGWWLDSTALGHSGNGYTDVVEAYEQLKNDEVERTVVHHGHAFNIDEHVLTALNKCEFHKKSDRWRIKKVFTWTNEVTATMRQYINPHHTYHTDGQIYGSGIREWWKSDGEVEDFDHAINTYAYSQKKGVRGLHDFWYSSGSDCDE